MITDSRCFVRSLLDRVNQSVKLSDFRTECDGVRFLESGVSTCALVITMPGIIENST